MRRNYATKSQGKGVQKKIEKERNVKKSNEKKKKRLNLRMSIKEYARSKNVKYVVK